MEALQEAIRSLADYQHRINQDTFRGDLNARTRYENAAYQEGMLSAAIAQAEQLKRIADVLEYEIGTPKPADLEPDAALEDYHYRKAQAQAWAKAVRGE